MQGTAERLCGAFHHFSHPDLEEYLSTLWNNLALPTEPSPWTISRRTLSAMIRPMVSSIDILSQTIILEKGKPSYSSGVHCSIISKIHALMPGIEEDVNRALLCSLRRGFVLRLLLDSRDKSAGPCHNLLWTIDHFVSSILYRYLISHTAVVAEPPS